MANLFFIHTPLQLMIAQMIIEQEKLNDNVMLCGYVDNNIHFLDICDLTIIEKLWSKRIAFPQVARWAVISRRHLWRDCKRTFRNFRFLESIIKKHNVHSLYIGDMWNNSCQLAAMAFHRKGLKICFFEEGNGHYILPYNYGKSGSYVDKVYAAIIDMLFYWPFIGVSYGYVHFWKGFTFSDLSMDVRYSVVPFYHEPFDKLLTVKPAITDKIEAYIRHEVSGLEISASILLMTSPLYEWQGKKYDKDETAYVRTIVEYAKSSTMRSSIHIKFHPRERDYVRKKILEELAAANINYVILGKKINIPVEYYLQFMQYDTIVSFSSSTSFYNGYLFPKVKFESILEAYYNNCMAVGSESLKYIEDLLAQIP